MRVVTYDLIHGRMGQLSDALAKQGITVEPLGRDAVFHGLAALDADAAKLLPLLIGVVGTGGAEQVRALRSAGCVAPMLVLMDEATADDLAALLDAGADDVIVAPFHPKVIAAKLRAAVRGRHDVRRDQVTAGALSVHMDGRHPKVAGREVRLSTKENEILRFLALNMGRVMPRSAIFDALYMLSDYQPHAKSIDVHICKIRKKLADYSLDGQSYIETFSGRGYALTRTERKVSVSLD